MSVDLYGPGSIVYRSGGNEVLLGMIRNLSQLIDNLTNGEYSPADESVTDAKVAVGAAIAQAKIAGLVEGLAALEAADAALATALDSKATPAQIITAIAALEAALSGTLVQVSENLADIADPAEALANIDGLPAKVVARFATGGDGTEADPYTSASGTGGLAEAVAAAAAAGVSVYWGEGFHKFTAAVSLTSGTTIRTAGAKTVMVADAAIAAGGALKIIGTIGSYIEDVYVGRFHAIRNGSGSTVRMQYARRCVLEAVTSTGEGGAVLSMEDSEYCQAHKVIGWDLGVGGSGVFGTDLVDCQFGMVIAVDGNEAVDLTSCMRVQMQQVISVNSNEEGLDIGNSRYCQFGQIMVINPTLSGVSLKLEDGSAAVGGSFHNTFQSVFVWEFGLYGFDIGNAPPTLNGTDVQNHNTIHQLTAISTKAGAMGVRVTGSTTNPAPAFNRFANVYIKTPDKGVHSQRASHLVIENGYVESTGAAAILLDTNQDNPTVRNIKAKGVPPATTSGVIQIGNSTTGCCIDDNEVLTSTQNGIRVSHVKGPLIRRNKVRNCQYHGINYNIPDDALYRGVNPGDIIDNDIADVGLDGSGARRCIQITQAGATAAESLRVRDNRLHDTQAVATSRGIAWTNTFANCEMTGNTFGPTLVSRLDGAIPATSTIRNNVRYPTETNGTATITSAATTVVVTHGLQVTPALDDISVTPTNNLGTSTKFWISTPTSSQFTINVDAAPGAGTATFAWSASIQ